MSIVNFSIPKTLEERVKQTIQQKGFSSKAEFFRFAAIHFIDSTNKTVIDENARFSYLTKILGQEISKRYKEKDMSSIEKQLADI